MADVGREAVAGEEGIRLLAPSLRIGLATKGRRAARDELAGSLAVGIEGGAVVRVRALDGRLRALLQDRSDGVVSDALELQLTTQRARSSRAGTVPALDPGARELEVVEVMQLDEALDDLVAQGWWIAQVTESPTRLLHRA